MRKLKDWELGYIAGLVDAEFHVSIQKTYYTCKSGITVPGYYTVLNMSIANKKIIDFVKKLCPGTWVRNNRKLPGHLPTKRIVFNRQDRINIIKAIIPFSQGRKEQLQLILDMENLREKYLKFARAHPRGQYIEAKPPAYIKAADKIYNKFRSLQLIRKGKFKNY